MAVLWYFEFPYLYYIYLSVSFEKTSYFQSHFLNVKLFTEYFTTEYIILPPRQIKYPVDFDEELKIGDVRYDDMT